MPKNIGGKTIEQLKQELADLRASNPGLTETQLMGIMVGKYGITHDSKGRILPVSLKELFCDDSMLNESSDK